MSIADEKLHAKDEQYRRIIDAAIETSEIFAKHDPSRMEVIFAMALLTEFNTNLITKNK